MAILQDVYVSGVGTTAVSGTLDHVANVMVVAGFAASCTGTTLTPGVTGIVIGGAPMTHLATSTVGTDGVSNMSYIASAWYSYRPAAANEYVYAAGVGTTSAMGLAAVSFTGTPTVDAIECAISGVAWNDALSLTVAAGQGGRRIIMGAGLAGVAVTPSGAAHTEITEGGGANARIELNYYDTDAAEAMQTQAYAYRSYGVAFALRAANTNLADETIPPCAPYMPTSARPRIVAHTAKVALTDILEAEIRLGSNGSMGSWQLLVADPLGLLTAKITEDERIVFLLRQGPVERRYTGIVQTVSHVRSGRRGPPYLKLTGSGYTLFLSRRNQATDYESRTIYDIITNTSDGLKVGVTELEWGPYIIGAGTTVSTSAKYRTISDVLNELMYRAGGATSPWTYWCCHGQHPGEVRENVHFRQKVSSPLPIMITEDEVLSSEILSTTQFLENMVEVEYYNPAGTTVLTTTCSDTTSITSHGINYRYVYAPFLTGAMSADDWGDKWLYRSKDNLRAISITIPFNLFLEPNYTIRYVTRTTDRAYEVTNVMHRLSEREAITMIEAATTMS